MLSPDLAPIAIALLIGLCAIGLVISLLYSRFAGQSPADVRRKSIASAGASSDGRSALPDEVRRRRKVEATLRDMDEKQKSKASRKPTLKTRMSQAGLSWDKRAYYVASLVAGCSSFVAAIALFQIGALAAIGFGIAGGLLLPHMYVGTKRKQRLKRFSAEFPNAVDIIVRGVKAGLPLVDCLKVISLEAQEPVRSEFKAIIEDQALGIPLDEAVQRLNERVPLQEANFFAIVIAIQSRTGGSLSEALGNLSKVLRERTKMQAKIRAMSSEAKASGGIIGALPIVVAVLVYLTTPKYISLLFTTFTGNLVLAASALWMGIGILVMRKMINFDF
jgi:tight adherence protein B